MPSILKTIRRNASKITRTARKSTYDQKKKDCQELEKQLNQNTQPENKTKLYWGIGLGILGMGLIGLVFNYLWKIGDKK